MMCNTADPPRLLTLEVTELEVSEVACQNVVLGVTRELPQLLSALDPTLQYGHKVVGDGSRELQRLPKGEGTITQRTTPACEPATIATCCTGVTNMWCVCRTHVLS